jgi:peptidoglycan hydrolase CwlO-like protein
MVKAIFIGIIFSFVVIVILIGTNTYAQSSEVMKKQQENTSIVNMTDEMKFLCIQIDASRSSIDQIKDKEQQAQCKKFLDRVSIYEMRELIDTYLGIEIEKTID